MPLVLVSVAFFLVAFGLVSGTLRLGAALAMLLVAIAVLVENPVLGWRGLVTGLLLIILFIPIRRYVLPGNLPFQLEPYRLYVILLVGGWFLALLADPRVKLTRTGFERPLGLLLFAVIASEVTNPARVNSLSSYVLKSMTFFLSFLFVVYVIASVIRTDGTFEVLVGPWSSAARSSPWLRSTRRGRASTCSTSWVASCRSCARPERPTSCAAATTAPSGRRSIRSRSGRRWSC